MDDTDPKIRALQFEIYRKMSAWEKVLLVDEMRRIERMLARIGLRSRHPDLTEEELERRINEMFLGKELADLAYGPRPGGNGR